MRLDLDADGRMDSISVPTGDDALLALDRNGNGRIDDGRELFGDQHGAANGFAELARFDDNGDEMCIRDSRGPNPRPYRLPPADSHQAARRGSAPVSYTHLDVYKRQSEVAHLRLAYFRK